MLNGFCQTFYVVCLYYPFKSLVETVCPFHTAPMESNKLEMFNAVVQTFHILLSNTILARDKFGRHGSALESNYARAKTVQYFYGFVSHIHHNISCTFEVLAQKKCVRFVLVTVSFRYLLQHSSTRNLMIQMCIAL